MLKHVFKLTPAVVELLTHFECTYSMSNVVTFTVAPSSIIFIPKEECTYIIYEYLKENRR